MTIELTFEKYYPLRKCVVCNDLVVDNKFAKVRLVQGGEDP